MSHQPSAPSYGRRGGFGRGFLQIRLWPGMEGSTPRPRWPPASGLRAASSPGQVLSTMTDLEALAFSQSIWTVAAAAVPNFVALRTTFSPFFPVARQ